MKPKAKRFRIRRSTPVSPGGPAAAAGHPTSHSVDAGSAPKTERIQRPADGGVEQALAAIREEGLTGRQLRMARRVAYRHGLKPNTDHEAVYMLRLKGIDPFERENALDLMVPKSETTDSAPKAKAQLPQKVATQTKNLPATDPRSPAERRSQEIRVIQEEMARRRNMRLRLLFTRLAAFVMIPTILAGWYFFSVATPMYASKSEFLILKAESSGGMGGLLSGTQFATNQDAIAVQSYLTSKDAMLRLDEDEGFREHFSQNWLDPVRRLEPDASIEDMFKLYKKYVQIGYDPTEGVIRMEVAAANPQIATDFSNALIGYAEERVDNLSARKRENAVSDAQKGLQDAEMARREAQERLVRLQQESSVLDPRARIGALQARIETVETQLQDKNLQLQALLDNARPNQSRVEGVQADIRRLQALKDEINLEMTAHTEDAGSLAETAVQIQMAEADLATRDMMLAAALERLDQASRDADSQARYLTTSVYPLPSQDPSYPRAFENTLLTFLVFSGIYLLISLTASILREQVAN
ncbi:capsular polysaccharide transport system permease protein [Marivita hallyeonensis]|uniref:Capsular polysaccharide transport system permease protein n=2 Tax=Marivita hallyeonensis TaxID=996342 RepID=A0A1M5M9G4_9RHOB|nr:capsular polysaccharide transport system permease protein [Marivita hallyeonensis]